MKIDSASLVGSDMNLRLPSSEGSLPVPVRGMMSVHDKAIYKASIDGWNAITRRNLLGPGPSELIAGTKEAGFYGTVTQEEFVNMQDLAQSLNMPGSFMNNIQSVLWLKFSYENKILFVPQTAITTETSWQNIFVRDAVYASQSASVEHGGSNYNLRLLTGASSDPVIGVGDGASIFTSELRDSEWTKLIAPVCDGTWENFSSKQMGFINRGQTWCQESDGNERVLHGVNRYNDFYLRDFDDDSSIRGWRPVLELVQ